MGLADEIMAAGHAERLFERHPSGVKVRIYGQFNRRRWHELWEGNPAIAGPDHRGLVLMVHDGPNCRPVRRDVGRLYLTPEEMRAGQAIGEDGPFVLVDPAAGWEAFACFETVIEANPGVRFVQCPQEGSRELPGVTAIQAPVRDACGIVAAATVCLSAGGWLQAAAASLAYSRVRPPTSQTVEGRRVASIFATAETTPGEITLLLRTFLGDVSDEPTGVRTEMSAVIFEPPGAEADETE